MAMYLIHTIGSIIAAFAEEYFEYLSVWVFPAICVLSAFRSRANSTNL